MPKFNPNNYQDSTIAEGDYPFVVISAEDRISKNGNEMIAIEMEFTVSDDRTITVYDYLTFTDAALFKIKQFCDAVGLADKWAAGELNADDCIGLEGSARLEKGDQYMQVAWYIPKGGWKESPTKKTLSPEESRKRLDGLKAIRSQMVAGSPSQTEHDDIPF